MDLTRVLVADNATTGVYVWNAGGMFTDLVIPDTQGQESDGEHGRGLALQDGATTDVTRALFVRNRGFGVSALDDGTVARLTDIAIEDTREQPCAATTCPDRPFGVGLAAAMSATMTATRFTLTASALCGVFLTENGELNLATGVVSGSPVGVCLQVDDYPVTRLTEGCALSTTTPTSRQPTGPFRGRPRPPTPHTSPRAGHPPAQ